MNELRRTFLDTSRRALDLVTLPVVAERWDDASALERFSVRGLVGHLLRATGSVEAYLDRGTPAGPAIDAPTYYAQAVDVSDIDSDLHRAVRARGEEAAAGGHDAVVEAWRSLLNRLESRLLREAPGRLVEVFKGLVLPLDDYLITRLVELVVHTDDVATSVGTDAPELPERAFSEAIGCLVAVARLRHGDIAVTRALTRRERDAVEALRVL